MSGSAAEITISPHRRKKHILQMIKKKICASGTSDRFNYANFMRHQFVLIDH